MFPAPLLRRLIAAGYDGLLLIGIWMLALLIDIVVRDLIGAARDLAALRAYVFLLGLGFFGWFWTHGGQTLGMRVWRLQVVSSNGAPLRWIDAALRYALTLVCWGVVLTPAVAQLPKVSAHPQAATISIIASVLSVLALLLMWRDPQRRAPQDWLSRTRMIVLPAPRQ